MRHRNSDRATTLRTICSLAGCALLATSISCGPSHPPPAASRPSPAPETTAIAAPRPSAANTATTTRPEPYPFKRAVVLAIGINRYPQLRGLADLRFAEADAKTVAEVLDRQYGFEVVSLYGPAASKRQLELTLKRLGAELGDGDALIVFFAGHGKVIPVGEAGEAGYLIPSDADLDANDVSDSARWAAQALDMAYLTNLVDGMGARHALFIADACCSGFMTTRGALGRADLKTFLFGRSRAVLAATTRSQLAREDDARRHGYFTAAFLDELRRDEAMSVVDLFGPVLRRVAQDTNGRMTPQLGHFGDGEGMFVFIPRAIPRSEIEADLDGRTPATEAPRGLARVALRQRERLALVTTEAEAYAALTATPYSCSPRAEELRQGWETRFARFRENAAAGDPWAMAALHACYAKGLGTDKDPKLAYYWSRQLDGFRDPAGAGRYFLAECYRAGLGVPKQEPAALKLYKEAADRGFLPAAVRRQEETLRKPAPTAGEIATAREILEKARERKYAPAAGLLGVLYESGDRYPGMKPDPEKAIQAYEEAASLGDSQVMITLARALALGQAGFPKDPKRAERYLRDAAESGNATAQYYLALEYDRGNPGRLFGLTPDDSELFRWALLSAEQGYAAAQVTVALDYLNGYGTQRNVDLARQWCEKAAAQNFAGAFVLQGDWYLLGTVYGAPDRAKAADLFRRAADLGHPQASLRYVNLYRRKGVGGFAIELPNWMEILKYATKAADGGMEPKDAKQLVWEAYKYIIQGQGETNRDRWELFVKTYPQESQRMKERLEGHNAR